MDHEILSGHELRVRLVAKIMEAQRAVRDAAAAGDMREDQQAAYKRLLSMLDELLSRVRVGLAEDQATNPPGSAAPREQGLGRDHDPR